MADSGSLAPRDENQFAYWGFRHAIESSSLVCENSDPADLVLKLVSYLSQHNIPYELDKDAQCVLLVNQAASLALAEAIENGRRFKDAALDNSDAREFRQYLSQYLARPLKQHQFKAALHLLLTKNAANFSVPGSGKTAVVLAVFERLRQLGDVDALFVVGPPACFGPWQAEYHAVLGKKPNCDIMAGGDIDTRRSKYLVNRDTVGDMYLTSFQTLQKDWEHVHMLFELQGIRFFFVVDEAHYIKQVDGAWAKAVLSVGRHAARRCILTGTPFPRQYADAFNLFDVLWPQQSPIPSAIRRKIELHSERKEYGIASEILDGAIGPLFYRVRKKDLGLAPQIFHDPVQVEMK